MTVVLTAGHVYSPVEARFLPRMDVLLRGGVIDRVAPEGSFPIPKDAQAIDARGRYIVPGLIDLHGHTLTRDAFPMLAKMGARMQDRDVPRFLQTFLAYGVTTVRDLGNFRGIYRLRADIERGRLLGPRILTAGNILEGPTAGWPFGRTFTTARAARAEVRRNVAQGADWIKIYANVTPSLARAAIQEARSRSLPVAGHVFATTARQAAGMGIRTLEHVYTLADDGFVPPRKKAHLDRSWGRLPFWNRLMAVWRHADLEGDAAEQLIARLRRHGTIVCPTLVLCENFFAGPSRELLAETDKMPERWSRAWEGHFRKWFPDGSPDPEWTEAFRRMKRFTWTLRRAGVRMAAGTDTAPFIAFGAPGASLHRELGILASLGLRPGEVLSIATAGAARALRRTRELGTVARGRSADLLILRRNPLADLANLRNPEAVLVRGREFRGSSLRPG